MRQRGSISRPIAPVYSVAGGDDTTRPRHQGMSFVRMLKIDMYVNKGNKINDVDSMKLFNSCGAYEDYATYVTLSSFL
jgi:hypothetical protein